MPNVLIHPARLEGDVALNARVTLERPLDFRQYGRELGSAVLRSLLVHHSDGMARFWGTHRGNASHLVPLRTGDVVLFTGNSEVWGWGVVGEHFKSTAFGKRVWTLAPSGQPFEEVYSLTKFERMEGAPTSVLNTVLGYQLNYAPRSPIFRSGEEARRLLDTMGRLSHQIRDEVAFSDAVQLIDDLEDASRRGAERFGVRRSTLARTQFTSAHREQVVEFAEARLVEAYLASLDADVSAATTKTDAGETDLLVERPGYSELTEAKSSTSRVHVRQALAQLLDYAPTIEPLPTVISALFPERPGHQALGLLARYGVDCIFRAGEGFERIPATVERRGQIRDFWS